jgi:CubicO group peptidase (beta-lactamase class C family)
MCKILIVYIILLSAYSCKLVRPIIYNIPDEKDAQRFPFRSIQKSADSCVFFFRKSSETIPAIKEIKVENRAFNSTGTSLDQFVKLHKTLSFLIIRNDTVLYEYYSRNYSADRNVTSFSIAKAYISMLIGIAIKEGLIKSVDDPITNYITEWRNKEGFNLITIKHLLKHTSGIRFNQSIYNPESDQMQFYYGTTLRRKILSATIQQPPGVQFNYESENPCLLALILERCTGKTVSEYMQEKIWMQIGTEGPAFWSTDRRDSSAIEKAFCCLNARTIDFAKFARLLLNKGMWNGKEIIPSYWIDEATTRSNLQGSKVTYGYNIGLGPAEYKSFFPVGLYGQYLYIYPKKNVIIVRFGNAELNYNANYWKEIMIQLVDQL